MIVYDLRKNIKQQQLGKNGAFWNWLGNFFGTAAEKSPEILNSIYGGATSDSITYVTNNQPATNANNTTDYNKYRTEKDNTLLYVGIGAAVVLSAVVIMSNNNSRRR